MDHDDSRLSPLWRGARRRPFRRLQFAIFALARAYDIRDGQAEDRFRITVADVNGRPITPSYSVPLAALDDLLLAVQDLTACRRAENEAAGRSHEAWADADIARLDRQVAAGRDPQAIKAEARSNYAEAARRTDQPDQLPT